jgi:hypothetical protein
MRAPIFLLLGAALLLGCGDGGAGAPSSAGAAPDALRLSASLLPPEDSLLPQDMPPEGAVLDAADLPPTQ